MRIRTLIVDDEPLARQRLRDLLEVESDFELAGESTDGRQAVAALQSLRPNLVFLDIQMPLLDGFGVVEAVGADRMPAVIFVTAYDRYALRAFEVHALDYLLKPFDRERFRKALDRARALIQRGRQTDFHQRLLSLLEDVGPKAKPLDRLVVKSEGRVSFVRVEEVDWIEAAGNYLRLHAGKSIYLLRETMNRLEARLDPQCFLRIHRSAIVNVDRIQELQPSFHGDFVVILRDGAELTLSRSYRDKFQEFLGDSL